MDFLYVFFIYLKDRDLGPASPTLLAIPEQVTKTEINNKRVVISLINTEQYTDTMQ